MQHNEFYKGVLWELGMRKTAQVTPGTLKPATPSPHFQIEPFLNTQVSPTQTTPSVNSTQPPLVQSTSPVIQSAPIQTEANPPTAPTPAQSTQPDNPIKGEFNIGNIKFTPETQKVYDSLEGVYPQISKYLPKLTEAYNNLPEDQRNNPDIVKNLFSNIISTGEGQNVLSQINSGAGGGFLDIIKNAPKTMANTVNSVASSANLATTLGSVYKQFNDLPTEQKAAAINRLAAVHPELAKILHAKVQEEADKFKTMNGGQLWDKFTGHFSNNKDTIGSILMRDPKVKALITNAMMGRAGQLTGQWLKDNWKTLTAVVGSGAMISLLYSVMKTKDTQGQQPTSRPTAPGFL